MRNDEEPCRANSAYGARPLSEALRKAHLKVHRQAADLKTGKASGLKPEARSV